MIETWHIGSVKEFLDKKDTSIAAGYKWRKINDSTYLVTGAEKPKVRIVKIRYICCFGTDYWGDSI